MLVSKCRICEINAKGRKAEPKFGGPQRSEMGIIRSHINDQTKLREVAKGTRTTTTTIVRLSVSNVKDRITRGIVHSHSLLVLIVVKQGT